MRLPLRRRPAGAALLVSPELVSRVPGWQRLTQHQRERLVEEADGFLGHVRFEAARGYAVTDEMRSLVAAHAALLTLELPDGVESYRSVSSVIVHRTTIVQTGQRAVGHGMYTDAPNWLAGQAHHRGPVLVAWDAARADLRHPERGESVLFHEFAHRLDMLDGVVDGTPPIDDAPHLARWVEVCTEAFERLRSPDLSPPSPVLRPYAGTNAGEFFAVATEAFFTVPHLLRESEPRLYDVLAGFYRQDPAPAP